MSLWKKIKEMDNFARKAMGGEITDTERAELQSARAQLRDAQAMRSCGDTAGAEETLKGATKTIRSIPD